MPASNMRGTVSRTAGTLLVCAQISLSYTPWRARGQHGTPPITEKRYCLCAYARAALHTSALSECCAAAVALQNQGAAARGRSRRSSRLRPIGNLRPGRGGQATGDPNSTSAAGSGQPCPTHATRPGSAETLALDHNNILRRVPCGDSVPASDATRHLL